MVWALGIALSVYIGMISFSKYRTPVAMLGAGILLIYGSINFQSFVSTAFHSFPTEIVILVIVLGLFSKAFEKNGVLYYLSKKFVYYSQGKNKLLITITITAIFVLSMFMNNLSVILLFIFICLELAVNFKLPIVPLLVPAIIASNIGGASLPWADTPAVILTLYTDMTLLDFITKLLVPCTVLTGCLLLYTLTWLKKSPIQLKSMQEITLDQQLAEFMKLKAEKKIKEKVEKKIEKKDLEVKEVKLVAILFFLFITGIAIAPFIGVSIAAIGLVFGGLLLILNEEKITETINSLPILDSIVFISSLFLIAGVLEHSGVFKVFIDYILSLTGQNLLLLVLSIMCIAFVIATFLSAGPAAATLLPVCQQLDPMVGENLVFVALALGILAGSSMLPWSATGGPIMLSEVERFLNNYKPKKSERDRIAKIFNLRHYTAFSIPFSLIILFVGGIFLTIYLKL